jgi:hypothetical protein
MRGLPDDFNGQDSIKKNMNLKEHVVVSPSVRLDGEFFGFHPDTLLISPKIQLTYDNYKGLLPSISGSALQSRIPLNQKSKFHLELGISDGTLSLNPTYALNSDNKFSGNLSFNTTEGLRLQKIGFARNYNLERTSRIAMGVLNSLSSFNFPKGILVTPTITMPRTSFSGNYNFSISGFDIQGVVKSIKVDVNFSLDRLKDSKISVPAYGYLNLDDAQDNESAMMDFYRENDGAYTKRTPCLPIATLTYDIFSVSGQGVAGSYRPLRNEVGTVFDSKINEVSSSTSLGFEAAIGSVSELGTDIKANVSLVNSGNWNDKFNGAAKKLKFQESVVQFVEANESSMIKDIQHFEDFGGGLPAHFTIQS